MICPNCNHEVPDGSNFCSKCGTPIRQEEKLKIEISEKKEAEKGGKLLNVIIGIMLALILLMGGSYAAVKTNFMGIAVALGLMEETRPAEQETAKAPKTTEEQTEAATTIAPTTEEPTTEEPTTAAPVYISEYEPVVGDYSWTEANARAIEAGGHLVTITSEEEYWKIVEIGNYLYENYGTYYIWVGSRIYLEEDTYEEEGWITGEDFSFAKWYPGQPSKTDNDGTKEYFLCLWRAKYEENGWTFNDQRDDLVGGYAPASGKVAYIIEYNDGY